MGKEQEARETKVLFCFQERGCSVPNRFVELKREKFKDNKDKSKYVSWFWIKPDGAVTRLKFRSWDKEHGLRMFEQVRESEERSDGWSGSDSKSSTPPYPHN